MGELSAKKLRLELSTSRIEALTDGVFAIAMTLLVLNFEVPNPLEGQGAPELHRTLAGLWPNLIHYVESFLILSIFWVKNHQQFHFIRHSDQKLIWLNLLSLLFVCLIPFTTSLVSDYGHVSTAAIIFEANLMAAGSVYWLQWRYVTGEGGLVDPNLDGRVIKAYNYSSSVTPAISLLAIAVSLFAPRAGTALYFLTPLILIYLKREISYKAAHN